MLLILALAQRVQRCTQVIGRQAAAGQIDQGRARADFQQAVRLFLRQCHQGLVKLNGCCHLVSPVGGVAQLGVDTSTEHGRVERHGRGAVVNLCGVCLEGVEHRRHQRRMECPRHVECVAADTALIQLGLDLLDHRAAAGDHQVIGPVIGGDGDLPGKRGDQLLDGQPLGFDGEHAACNRHAVHQVAALDDQAQAIFHRKDPGSAGCSVLAQAVPDNGRRRDAKAGPEAGQGILETENRRLGVLGLAQRLRALAPQHIFDAMAERLGVERIALLQCFAECRLGGVELLAHAGVL
ncbi:hypothetical protein D3C76_1030520 [compost metagenome]